jgi:hypothetical protein
MKPPLKIISGGQTGADRAALDWAITNDWPHGGWCPKGRTAEDGTIPECYLLQETPLADPSQRTEWNVRDSDGTVILSIAPTLIGGSQITLELAQESGKPVLHLYQARHNLPGQALAGFVRDHKIQTLNVAGSRASQEPNIARFVREVLNGAFIETRPGNQY